MLAKTLLVKCASIKQIHILVSYNLWWRSAVWHCSSFNVKIANNSRRRMYI